MKEDATTTLAGEDRPDVDSAVPSTIGRYTIIEPLGAGGMGIVFTAHDPELDRKVAIKLVRPKLRPKATSGEPAMRLLREARAMATLTHENVVPVFDAGEHGGRVYIAMELVEGESLEAWLRVHEDAPLPSILDKFLAAARGLAAAHAAGIVHRDFKPDNVLVGNDGRVRVLDFGLAKWGASDPSVPTQQSGPSAGVAAGLEQNLTREGAVMGTLGYIPPEQLRLGEASARSDQFSFFASLFRALFGQRPFRPISATDWFAFEKPPQLPPEHGRPRWLVDVVMRGLSVDPDGRFESMTEAIEALERGPGRSKTPIVLAGAGVAAVAVVLALALRSEPPAGCEAPDERIAEAWPAAARESIAAATTGEAALRALDDYADRWVAAQRRTCDSVKTLEGLALDRRMRCLANARRSLRALTEVFADSSKAVVRAPILIGDLHPPAACEDDEALARRIDPPSDSKLSARVTAVRDELTEVRALASSGQSADAVSRARAANAIAAEIEYPPVHAEALAALGYAEDEAGTYSDALSTLERAYLKATEAGHDEVAAATAIKLVYVVGYRVGKHDESARWGREAAAALSRFGPHPKLEAKLESNLGAVQSSAGRDAESLEHLERALAMRRAAFGEDSMPVAVSLSNTAVVLRALGRSAEAKERAQASLAIFERELGPDHPELAARLNSLGMIAEGEGDLAGAQKHYARALELTTKAYGETHPEVANYLNAMAGVARRREQWPLARAYLERGLKALEATVGNEHPAVAGQLTNLGHVLAGAGEHRAAVEHYRRALAIIEARWRPDHPNLVMPLQGLGEAFLALEDSTAAAPVLRRALAIAQEHKAPEEPTIQFELAVALWESTPDKAIELAKVAREAGGDDLRLGIDAWLDSRP